MRKIIILACFLLSGCGSHYVIPASSTRPAQIYTSAYTMSGCMENLAGQAHIDGCELNNIKTDASGLVMEVLFFPFFKGYTCTADATPRK